MKIDNSDSEQSYKYLSEEDKKNNDNIISFDEESNYTIEIIDNNMQIDENKYNKFNLLENNEKNKNEYKKKDDKNKSNIKINKKYEAINIKSEEDYKSFAKNEFYQDPKALPKKLKNQRADKNPKKRKKYSQSVIKLSKKDISNPRKRNRGSNSVVKFNSKIYEPKKENQKNLNSMNQIKKHALTIKRKLNEINSKNVTIFNTLSYYDMNGKMITINIEENDITDKREDNKKTFETLNVKNPLMNKCPKVKNNYNEKPDKKKNNRNHKNYYSSTKGIMKEENNILKLIKENVHVNLCFQEYDKNKNNIILKVINELHLDQEIDSNCITLEDEDEETTYTNINFLNNKRTNNKSQDINNKNLKKKKNK